MPWINLTAPAAGDPTEVDFAEDIVNNLAFVYNQFLSVVGTREVILNGSFESDADADTYPDGWTRTLYTGGSFTYRESVVAADGLAWHGKRSISFTSPGGGGNGGGYITSESFFEVSEGRPYKIQFATKSTAVGIHNKAEIKWYDSTQTLISTTTFHEDSSTNPAAWTVFEYLVQPPANARYAKLLFYGAVDDDTTAGTCYYDDIRILSFVPPFENRVMFNTPGNYKWRCPANAEWVAITVIGGGGGGGGDTGSDGSGGGGAGGLSFDIQRLTPGTKYLFTIGAGGAGDTGSGSGTAGGASSFTGTATLTSNGGSGGASGGGTGAGGAGGTGTGGRINQTGESGDNKSGNNGGDGGGSIMFGGVGKGGLDAGPVEPTSAPGYGGGGGGSRQSGDGASGANGVVIIRWG